MQEAAPFITVCGLLCLWPALVFAAGIWIGKNGIPVRVTWKLGGRKRAPVAPSAPASSRYGE